MLCCRDWDANIGIRWSHFSLWRLVPIFSVILSFAYSEADDTQAWFWEDAR